MKSIKPQGKDPKEKVVIAIAIFLLIVTIYLKVFTNHFN